MYFHPDLILSVLQFKWQCLLLYSNVMAGLRVPCIVIQLCCINQENALLN
jgi:hypothetical protein